MGKKLDSDVIYLNLIGQPLVILNSARAASDLLEKRSSIYSDRIGAPMVNDPALLDWSTFAGMLPYNDIWRRQRRRITNWFNPRVVRQFDGLQQDEARLLLGRLLNISASSNLYAEVHNQLFFTLGSAMFRATYGYRLKGDKDPFYLNAFEVSHNLFDATMMSNFLVNAFPILSRVPDWVPGTGWKRIARKWREQKNEAVNAPYEWAKRQIASGDFEKSILSALLEDDEGNSELSAMDREIELKELCYTLFLGGTDTTATALVNFVASMVSNPEVQNKAQAEIDAVIGYATRLPTLADQDQLPYLRKLTLEVLRWLPVAPTGGPPHGCTQDDNYRGYDIQKGTIVVGNLWYDKSYMSHNPEKFDPERFADPTTAPFPGFGWGRRKCPGMHFAEVSLFLIISSVLTTFTLDRKKDKVGKEIVPKIEGGYNALAL
ncbi:O-methylsterigmatocystin oxidoreductase Short=OMST oxidoreductase [Rhizoctonia solani AG-1 IB]|uniref:O-methylsterigmatocystin oxidoreductase Short=OMST oxidoreductase n=1 Tax=Thanatephorus cucumeris (strain AG1-IB / isolate 7/3/14) TaxID=1108050 RepID=M5C1S1_THACB|nr:O-methylsterigmatocystin oxidoreductase Short=OMST oxidoreductase [Rhizoctonia solani AG-1 IB]